MSHLLASVNPQAAAQIQPDAPRPRLPGVGQSVVYHMRRGHGRNGRTSFPALVQARGERDTLSLTVIIDAGDLIDEQFVEQIGPGKDEGHCWEWPEGVGPMDRAVIAPADMFDEPSLGDQIAELRACVLGDFDIPKVSLIDIIAKLEARVIAAEAKIKSKK